MDATDEILRSLEALFDPLEETSLANLQGRKLLPREIRTAVEGRLAELGYCLKLDVELFGLAELGGRRVQFRDGIIAFDRRTLNGSSLKKEVLLYDIPFSLIYYPACEEVGGDPDVNVLVAHALTLESIFKEVNDMGGYLWGKQRSAEYHTLSKYNATDLAYEITKVSKRFDEKNCDPARELINKLKGRYPGRNTPISPVSHNDLKDVFDGRAWQWIMDRFGWLDDEGRLLPLQVLAVGKGVAGELLDTDGLVAGPTSSGKTLVAEMRMLARWSRLDHDRRHTVMLVPTKEIGLERAEEMRLAYGYDSDDVKSEKLRVVYSDGDNGREDYQIWRGDFDLAILVNEKFRYFQQSEDFLSGVGEVVIDEMEIIGKEDRGQYLELLLTSILSTQREISITCLTRQFSNPDDLLDLLRRDKPEPFFIQLTRRPFPIEIGIWEPNTQTVRYTNCNDLSVREDSLALTYPGNPADMLKELLKAFLTQTDEERTDGFTNNIVLATPTKRDNLQIAEYISNLYDTDFDVQMLIDDNANTQFIRDRLRALEPSKRKEILSGLLPKGIGVHDADLSPHERLVVSRAFRDREIPILITSQTMAYGVNLPAQTIVFLGWDSRPMSLNRDRQHDQYVVKLQDDFITWLGRVGRFGQPNHRIAKALYLCVGGRTSEEYVRITSLVTNPLTPIYPSLAQNLKSEDTVLYVLRSVQQTVGGGVTWDEIEKFYSKIYRASEQAYMAGQALVGLLRIGGFKFSDDFHAFEKSVKANQWPDVSLEAIVDRMVAAIPVKKKGVADKLLSALVSAMNKDGESLDFLRELADTAYFRAMFVVVDESASFSCVDLDKVDDGILYETNRLGNIACGFGVDTETVRVLSSWLDEAADYKSPWHVLDLLALVSATPNGERLATLRPSRDHYDEIRAHFEKLLSGISLDDSFGSSWQNRSPLIKMAVSNVHLMATFMSLHDWSSGLRLLPPDEDSDGIETKYGLAPYGSNIRDRAKDYGRILRVLEAIASSMPKLSEEEREKDDDDMLPESKVASEQSTLILPQDLPIIVDEIQQGMPFDAVDLGRTGIEGLSRTWALDLFDKMEETDFETDLPVLERLRLFAEELDFFDVVPTPGLGQRIKKELDEKPRSPIAEHLRHFPTQINEYYANEIVRNVQIAQGYDRYTALKMSHRRAYTVMRRNISKRNPIKIDREEHYDDWVAKGAIEFLSEVGFVWNGQYYLDRFLVDLDPRNGFSLERLKALTLEIGKRLEVHQWTDVVYFHWTGGRGFHIVGEFKEEVYQKAEQVKRVLEKMIDRLSDDVAIFTDEQPYLLDPYVVIDLKPVMNRGLYRNALSLNSNTGGVCVPLTPESIEKFDPEKDATIDRVVKIMDSDIEGGLKSSKAYRYHVDTYSGLALKLSLRDY